MPRPGTVLIPFFAAMALFVAGRAFSAVKEPPYVAIVEVDGAVSRCGPGKNYYSTLQLPRGSRVTVRRQDPGGWFMIDPPLGSFSLIRADDVERNGNVGTVKRLDQGQASIRVGSSIDPASDSVFQRRLSSGERVEILGEVSMPRRDRSVTMFKIRPPKGEYRWVEGTFLAPPGPGDRPENQGDPFGTSLQAGRGAPPVGQPTPASAQRRIAPGPEAATAATNDLVTIPSVHRNAAIDPVSWLDRIDSQFHDMVRTEPATWNLPQIEQSYRQLAQYTNIPSIRSQIDQRLTAVAHYRDVKAEYDDYFRLASATSRRDAELAAIENSLAPQNGRPPIGAVATPYASVSQYPPLASNGLPTPTPAVPPVLNVPNSAGAPGASSLPEASSPQTSRQPKGPILEAPVPEPIPVPPATPQGSEVTGKQPGEGTQDSAQTQPPIAAQQLPAAAPSANPSPSTPFAPVSTEGPSAPAPPANPQPSTVVSPSAPSSPSPGTMGGASPYQTPRGYQPPPSYQPSPIYPPLPNYQPTPAYQPRPGYQPSAGYQLPPGYQMPPGYSVPSSAMPQPSPVFNPQSPAAPQGPGMQGSATVQMAPPRQIRPQGPAGLDGAGIIQRAAMPVPNGPRHVLLSPEGRILAYLYPDRGLNLDAYVGRPMGIKGPRSFHPELRTDLIIVRGMMPVRLIP
jgi:hypothetical protein